MFVENWLPINNFEGYYISDLGRIWSTHNETYLKPYLHKSRAGIYLRARFKCNKKKMVHILVAEHFRREEYLALKTLHPELRLQVDHRDGNTLNPANYNIEWVTEKENKLRMRVMKKSPNLKSWSDYGKS